MIQTILPSLLIAMFCLVPVLHAQVDSVESEPSRFACPDSICRGRSVCIVIEEEGDKIRTSLSAGRDNVDFIGEGTVLYWIKVISKSRQTSYYHVAYNCLTGERSVRQVVISDKDSGMVIKQPENLNTRYERQLRELDEAMCGLWSKYK